MPDRADERPWLKNALGHANARVVTLETEFEEEKEKERVATFHISRSG